MSADILAAAIGREASDMALRDSEGEMAALFNAMRDPVFVIDKNGVYRKVFACDETLLALPPSELLGRSLSDIFETEVARQFQSALDM